jgi:hypothetical protein
VDVNYVSQYRCSARAHQVLKALGSSTAVVTDWHLFNKLSAVGFELDPERDNKSVWSPEWVRIGLERFGDSIPFALREWEFGKFQATNYSKDELAFIARARPRPSRSTSTNTSSVIQRGTRTSGYRNGRRPVTAYRTIDVSARVAVPDSETVNRRVDIRHVDPRVYADAKAATLSTVGCRVRGNKPLSVDEVVDKVLHHSHFAGAPYFCSNRDALERATRDSSLVARGERAFDPYVAGRRVQHGPSGPKGRLVWMAPLSTTLLASRYSKAIYDGLSRAQCFAYGTRKSSVGGYISELQSRFKWVYSLDFSAFDAKIPAYVLNDVFNILRTWLELDDDQVVEYNRIVHDFIHSRIVLPDGSMWQVHRGVPSGNPFTSLVDSVANLLIINYCLIKATGVALKADQVMVLGDDSVFGTNHYVPLTALASAASDVGMVLSVEKSGIATLRDKVEFLGHSWQNARPYRPLKDLAIRMAFPERHKKRTRSESLIRLYSYLADCEDSITMFAMIRYTYGNYLDMARNVLYEAGVSEVNFESGPGRLQYLEMVERDTLPANVRQGITLAAVGILY